MGADQFKSLVGLESLSKRESSDLLLAVTTLGTIFAGTAWFFFTSLFYNKSSREHIARVEEFFTRLKTPVAEKADEGLQGTIYKMLGVLCLIYGVFIMLLVAVPNGLTGRMCFIFCGGVIFVAGATLYAMSKRCDRRVAELSKLESQGVAGPATTAATVAE